MSDHRPWSSSKIKVANQCDLRFHYQYNTEFPEQIIAHPAGRIGGAIHETLEDILSGTRKLGEAFRRAVHRQDLSRKETMKAKEYEEDIKAFVKKFSKWRKEKVDVQKVEIEKEAAITKNLDPCHYWDDDGYFRGIWDIAVDIDDGGDQKIVIIDHKTGRKKDIEEYKNQLQTYMVTAIAHYPDAVGIQPALHWLRASDDETIEWYKYHSRQKIEQEIVPWLHEYIAEAEESADRATNAENPEPSPGWYCQFCPWKYRCPAKN